jgi:hypothetical protein
MAPPSNVLAIWLARRVDELIDRRQMFGPSLCAGGERDAPHEGRNSNGSALAVMHGQDGVADFDRLRVTILFLSLHSKGLSLFAQYHFVSFKVKCSKK